MKSIHYYRGAIDSFEREIQRSGESMRVDLTNFSRIEQWKMLLADYEKAMMIIEEHGISLEE